MPVTRTGGGRHDITAIGCCSLYINRSFHLDFIEYVKDDPDHSNILEDYHEAMLSSIEIAAGTRSLAIIHILISLPWRFLAGKGHELQHLDLSAQLGGAAALPAGRRRPGGGGAGRRPGVGGEPVGGGGWGRAAELRAGGGRGRRAAADRARGGGAGGGGGEGTGAAERRARVER